MEVYPKDPALVWLQTPPPGLPITLSSRDVALIAMSTLAPPATDPRPPTGPDRRGWGNPVVNVHTWYWTDPGTTATLRPPRTEAGGAWAEIVATPTFQVTAGDGTPMITCTDGGSAPGPGVDPVTTASPSGCEHVYRTTSINAPDRKFTATYTIAWLITFTGSDTPNPTVLTTVNRTETDTFPVTQIQTLVVGR